MEIASSSSSFLSIRQTPLFPNYPSLHFSQFRPLPKLSSKIRAVAIVPDSNTKSQDIVDDVDLFACPVCYEPLIRKGPPGFNLQSIYRSGFRCNKCKKSYTSKNTYLDLTVTAGARAYTEFKPAGSELFLSPLISFVYESGWRQNCNRRGFPGPDEEFKMAKEIFKPIEGGILVDVSCGSGLFSWKFAKSRTYSRVVALDFSENILHQADVSRLPFASDSVDAVHAGAALHCWPSPSNAIAEINGILRSGGVFVGTTFLRVGSSNPEILRPFGQRALRDYNYLTAEEIEDLCSSCGLINYRSKIQQSFIMFSAQKPRGRVRYFDPL